MSRLSPTPPILSLLPALALLPVLISILISFHNGGVTLLWEFICAAVHPSIQAEVVQSAFRGIQITLATALLSWSISSIFGICLGIASARVVWETFLGTSWPAIVIRRLLAIPRAIHELLWGLLLLQMVGLSPWVAIVAIVIPYSSLVARVVSDQLDTQDRRALRGLKQAGAGSSSALITALGPAMGPVLLSYVGYRLECALRGATVLGVFGLGGIGTDLQLALQSLQFHDVWTALWLLAAVMFSLEQILSLIRRYFKLSKNGIWQVASILIVLLILCALSIPWLNAVDIDLGEPLHWSPLPLPTVDELIIAIHTLPWIQLISSTMLLTVLAAGIAIGTPPLAMMLWPSRLGIAIQRIIWGLLRLMPTPLTALFLLLFSKPSVAVAALALGAHNIGVMGRLLKEGLDQQSDNNLKALSATGAGARSAWLYGCFSGQSRSYLAYAAYRTDVILRETVVVGMVGGTGLGWQLIESLGSFNWAQVSVLIAVFTALTLIGESITDRLRYHWTGSTKKLPMVVDLQS